MKTYEGMFILGSAMKDDVLDKAVEKIQGEITRLNGKLLETQKLGERSFARPMKKKESGVYVKIFFDLDPLAMSGLMARFRLNEELLRVQVTVREVVPPEAVAAPKPAPTV